MKKILIIGANGQLGADINTSLSNKNYITLTPNHEELDITNFEKVTKYILQNKPEIIINTAAYHQVDKCEEFPLLATLINNNAPTFISKLCKEINCKLIHFSTDYVFDGAKGKPYLETDLPNPLNVYGKTKYEGEKEIFKASIQTFLTDPNDYRLTPFDQGMVSLKMVEASKESSLTNQFVFLT